MAWTFWILLASCFLQQGRSINPPSKENLCGFIVDLGIQEKCLECFEDAEPLSDHPEEFRRCVAIYLPPIIADCAVPHHERTVKMQQFKPQVHHNHTNANLMPSCLKRRMRELSRYLRSENRFSQQAGKIIKMVVAKKVLPLGGPNLLGAMSQRYILDLPTVKNIVDIYAQECTEAYDESRSILQRSNDFNDELFDNDGELNEDYDDEYDDEDDTSEEDSEEDFDDDDEDLEDVLKSLETDSFFKGDGDDVRNLFSMEGGDDVRNLLSMEGGDDVSKADIEQALFRSGSTGKGNNLPYGGTNPLAEDIIYGKCVIDKLIEKKLAFHLIQIISNEEFYHPIPFWWVEPLLRYYKDFRESLEDSVR